MYPRSIEIIKPDDFHHHFRDGEFLGTTVGFASRAFSRVIAMPNIVPPVRCLSDAISYKERIMASVPGNSTMTIYN